VDLGAHDLAAVQIQDQVQVEPAAHHVGRQVRDKMRAGQVAAKGRKAA
jgi:hypothetical protein